ncbi:hypothetical protein KAU85_04065 [Candidatus Bathyarchaeota archaeon]|nr:hypothetical protein [Candidatus Bathyarchaeota archaeon]
MVVGQSVIDNGSSTENNMVLEAHRYVAAIATGPNTTITISRRITDT